MNIQIKRALAGLLCLVLLAALCPLGTEPVHAVDISDTVAQQHYGSYGTLAMVYDQNSCYSMQGMTVDNTYAYCAKVGSDDARAIVTRIDKSTGTKTLMTDASTGYSYFTNLGHANALDIVAVNGKSNLFVTGGSNLVRLTVSGTTLTTAGTYTATYNGAAASMTAAQVMSASDTEVTVIVKSGRTLYTGTLNPKASSGVIALTKLCTLDVTNVRLKGTMIDYSAFTQQGFDYHDGKIFLPLTGNASADTINQSVVLVYDLEGASGTIRNDPTLSFRIISGTYAGLFEIEDCAVCPTTGQLYFDSNRRKTSSDTDYDGVSFFTGYAYNPAMSTTGADDYRWEMIDNRFTSVTDGGNTFNHANQIHGNITDGTMSQVIYGLSRSVVLNHDQPWSVEWKSSGTFSTGSMMLATSRTAGVTDSPYLFRYKQSEFIAIGYWNGSQHNNYGIRLGDYGIDGTAEHVYRLTNKIAADGSNMVYLSVDGKELGAMNNYYINATSQGTTSNWLSGKDFTFSYLGSYGHPLNYCQMDYLQIWAQGVPDEAQDTYRWETLSDNLTAMTGDGLTANTATLYRGSVTDCAYSGAAFRLNEVVKLLHDHNWAIEWQCEGSLSGGTFLFASSDGSKTKGAPFLFRYGKNLIFLGAYDGSQHANYGIDLSDYGIDGSAAHVYRLANKVATDGSNMVYLSVDGVELGAMNNCYNGINPRGTTSDWVSGKDFVFDYMGTNPYPINDCTMDYVQAWEDGAPCIEESEEPTVPVEPEEPADSSTATGTIAAYLDRVDAASDLKEGVPYVISDYKDSWKHYTLTTQEAQKTSGSKTHTGYLLDGTPGVDTKDLWYIRGGKLVYGAADSDQYLLISYDSASQGLVQLGSYNASSAAYVTQYSGDNFAIRSGSYYLNRHGGTASDVVATAYTSAGGSYWHLDRLVGEQSVTLSATAPAINVLAGSVATVTPEVMAAGTAAESHTINWTSSDSAVATVSGSGTVTGLKAGTVTLTATLTAVGGRELVAPISVEISVTVEENTGAVSAIQAGELVLTGTLQTGVPYVITERVSGDALTGEMAYTTDSDYKGLSGIMGLKTADTIDLSNAPVWYYDGTYLRYGSASGTNNYLISNASNQVVLGSLTEGNPFDKVTVYSTSDKTFNLYPSGRTSGSTNYYLNQLGGSNYNVAGFYASAYYSRWQFSQLLPQRSLTLSIAPGAVTMYVGDTAALTSVVAVDGSPVSSYSLTWSSSDESVATVSGGIITGKSSGEAVITATLTSADGRALDEALSMEITLQVEIDPGYTATAVQESKLVKVASLEIGVPYVLTERVSGAALTGDMIYTTDSDYKGLSGTQGLKTINGVDLDNAPVWYYDGTYLLYGSPYGSNNYLVYNSSNQVALGTISEANIFDKITVYSTSDKTFNLYPSGKSTSSKNYYLNQLGGANYNAAGLYSSAYYSRWQFSEPVAEKAVSLNVTPGLSELAAGKTAALTTAVTVNGVAVSDCQLTWETSNGSVATVTDGVVTAVSAGSVTITVTLTGAQGDIFSNPVTIEIPLTISD